MEMPQFLPLFFFLVFVEGISALLSHNTGNGCKKKLQRKQGWGWQEEDKSLFIGYWVDEGKTLLFRTQPVSIFGLEPSYGHWLKWALLRALSGVETTSRKLLIVEERKKESLSRIICCDMYNLPRNVQFQSITQQSNPGRTL